MLYNILREKPTQKANEDVLSIWH